MQPLSDSMPVTNPLAIGPVHAHALLSPDAPAHELMRIALLHLSALKFVGTELEPRRGVFSGPSVRFHRLRGYGHLPAELAPVLDALFPPARAAAPLSRTDLAQRLQVRFGYDYGKYRSKHVRPALVERGWVAEEAYRTLGLIPRRRLHRTAEGERMAEKIEACLRPAADAAARVAFDPRGALAVVAVLGPLALLVEPLRPHLATLAQAARSDGAALPAELFDAAEKDERRTAWLDALGMVGELDWASLVDAIDGFGDAGADGGGDGGGGGGGE